MRILMIITVCASLLHNGIAEEEITVSQPPYCSRKGISCYDRHTQQHCSTTGHSGLEFIVSCKLQNPNRPYCFEYENQVECVTEDISIPEQGEPEICYSSGFRPDPTNCSRYIQCEPKQNRNGFFGSVVNCPSGTGYSINDRRCTDSGSCSTIHAYCTGNEGKLVAYPPYPSIYVKCPAVNSNGEFIVKLCKNDFNFNEQIGACEQICKNEGYMPNNENCKAYYNCVRDSNSYNGLFPTNVFYSITSNICPTGTGFNRKTKLCDESQSGCINLIRIKDLFVDYIS